MRGASATPPQRPNAPIYAAVDLGSNNCRLLVAAPRPTGAFEPLLLWSRIVRLGEGVAATGRLSEAAMSRARAALRSCARKIAAWPGARVRAIATAACRSAANGAAFLADVARETGLPLEVITPREEAELSARACADLIDPGAEAALVVDIGGGSTELSWVGPRGASALLAWASVPLGVVALAERAQCDDRAAYDGLVCHAVEVLRAAPGHPAARAAFEAGRAQLVGCSGALTALAALKLGLRRYDRARIDGLWLSPGDVSGAADLVCGLGPEGRASHPCIGPKRADLVAPGAAILEAVLRLWPAERIRVGDRGLREGLVLRMMEAKAP